MEDLRIWFLESRIRLLWSGISDKSWMDFLTDESGKNRKALKDLLDGTGTEKVMSYSFLRNVPVFEK